MPDLWKDLKKSLVEWGTAAADKAGELTRAGRIKLDLLGIKREIEKNFIELGGRVYHLIHEESARKIAGNPDVKKIIDRIASLESTLEEKREELKTLGEEEEDIDVEPVKKEDEGEK